MLQRIGICLFLHLGEFTSEIIDVVVGIDRGLNGLPIFSQVSFGSLCLSRNPSILSKLLNLWG